MVLMVYTPLPSLEEFTFLENQDLFIFGKEKKALETHVSWGFSG